MAIKTLDQNGKGNASDVLAGLQWVIDNRQKYNIRVVNLSIGALDIGNKDPLVRAVDAAWDMGICMVIAAGNNGPAPGSVTSPGISRKVITVGASDDDKSVTLSGNKTRNYSGRGPTSECIIKPDVLAPGADIISCLTPTPSTDKLSGRSGKIISDNYLQLSGTSMSTPIVSGAIALLLQKCPHLHPDDVKLMLKSSSTRLDYSQNHQSCGIIDIEKLMNEEAKHVR